MADVEMQIRVRYHEVDRMGIAYHPRYLSWFEMARLELLRGLGHPYAELEAGGLALPITRVEVSHRRPLAFDEVFRLTLDVAALSGARFTLKYQVLLDGDVVCDATTQHAAVRLSDKRPTRLPADLRASFGRLASRGGELTPFTATDPIETRLHPLDDPR